MNIKGWKKRPDYYVSDMKISAYDNIFTADTIYISEEDNDYWTVSYAEESQEKTFPLREQALNFAQKYMLKHPNGE